MPSRNVTKVQVSDSYYHVYVRGSNKQQIFIEDEDYKYLLKLFHRYLSRDAAISSRNEVYPNFRNQVEILAYCLMKNHFHILVYQIEVPSLEKFMRSLMTSYSRYFNLKYKRTGPIYESRYKAVRIDNNLYLQHVSRYIHLNPKLWQKYKYSSMRHYSGEVAPDWLNIGRILDQYSSREDYIEFVSDYEEMHDILDDIKHQLADR